MSPLRLFILAVLVAFGCSCGALSPSGTRMHPSGGVADLVIRDVTVIDGTKGLRPNRSVYVKAGKVWAVRVESEPVLAARREIDGAGRYLIPGLWDMHVHVTYLPGLTEAMPGLFLDYGITSVRDTGGLLRKMQPVLADWRDSQRARPRIYWSGPLLDGARVVYDGHGRPEIGVATATAEAARAHVKSLAEAGVDFIKIYELVSPEVFAALVAAARARALPIAAHVPLSLTAQEAGPQVDSMEHLRNVELACSAEAEPLKAQRDEILAAAAAGAVSGHALRSRIHREQRTRAFTSIDARSVRCRGVIDALRHTIQVPTLRLNTRSRFSPLARPDWEAALGGVPRAIAEQWRKAARERMEAPDALNLRSARWSLALVAAMHEAGVPIGAGTDTPIGEAIPGYSLHTELERLVAAGLSPLDALRAATQRPAEFLGLEHRTGQIAAGMNADLVLLGANPLDRIEHTRKIEAVILGGELVRGEP